MNLRSRILMAAAIIVAGGCASLTKLAPPVTPAMSERAATAGVDSMSLERGRVVYIRQCAKCHSPIAIQKYTAAEWSLILPKMNEKTGLSAEQAVDLDRYIDAVLDLPQP